MEKKGVSMFKKALILGIAGFAIVYGLFYYKEMKPTNNTSKILEDRLISSWVHTADLIAFIVKDGVSDKDEIVTSAVLSMFSKKITGSDYITIISNDNTILADLDTTKVLQKFSGPVLPGKSSKITKNMNSIDIGVPVTSAGEKVGEIHIGLSKTKLFPKVQKNPMDSVMYGGIAFVIFFLIGLVIARGGVKSVASSEKLKEELERLKDTVSSLHGEETNLSEIIEKKKAEMADIEKEIKNKEEEINKINEEYMKINEKKQEVESVNKQLEELKVSLEEKKKELASTQKEVEERAKVAPKGEEEVLISNIIGEDEVESRVEEKKKQEVELTQRIVAKRREEIALSARIEAKRKELIELERKIEELKGKSS